MTIHLIDGEKGGVGKSWIAFVVIEYLASRNIPCYLYAADRSNPTAASRYKDKQRYADFYDDSVHYAVFSEDDKKADDPDVIIDMATERTVVIDLPAQVHYPLTSWLQKKDIFRLSKANGIDWIRWFVCNGEEDSINLLVTSAAFYQNQKTILVRNHGLCDDWSHFNDHPELQSTIEKYQITVIDFPKLVDSKRIKINANRWTFDEAVDLGKFNIVGKSDIHQYVQKAFQLLDSIKVLEVL